MAGLYIHIPYCIRKCAYCDFVSVPTENGVPEAYFTALLKEIDVLDEELCAHRIETVFIGGGTPSLLLPKQLETLLTAVYRRFDVRSGSEFTMECNPGTVDYTTLSGYRALGVNRLSIGLQSSEDRLLQSIGRIHNAADFQRSIEDVRHAGFTDYNVDIMYGLPRQKTEDLLKTVDTVSETGAAHISAYSLILEENTPLFRSVHAGKVFLPDEDSVADMEDAMRPYIEQYGYKRYEISNYAKEGHRCLHNVNYWENGEYIGLGPAAHSAFRTKTGWTRWNNTEDIAGYIFNVTNGETPVIGKESIKTDEEMFETLMLGLRMTDGVDLNRFYSRFGISCTDRYRPAVERLRSKGWLNAKALSEGRLALSEKGMDLQNSALLEFLEEKEK